MSGRSIRSETESREAKREAEAVERQLQRAFTPEEIDQLRAETGYNPRQRVGTALRLMSPGARARTCSRCGWSATPTRQPRSAGT